MVAPRVLALPYHHCVYELLTDTPAMGLAGAMTLAGFGVSAMRAALKIGLGDAQLFVQCVQGSSSLPDELEEQLPVPYVPDSRRSLLCRGQ